jgi:hypothetical protein
MEAHAARALTRQLGDNAATPNGQIVKALAGYVQAVIAARIPDGGAAAIAVDEHGLPVIVAVGGGRVILLRAVGDSTDEFSMASELVHLDHPDVKVSVEDTTVKSAFSSGVFIEREWLYEFGDGRSLRLSVTEERVDDDDAGTVEALERALADAAGWPVA